MSALPAAIGRYEVQAFIARGGMGTLYLATDPVLQRQVAIKLLREADNEELRTRFTREARSAANLRHRNIVTIFDVGDHEGQPFMAMEFVQGDTLTALIDRTPPPSIIRRLQLTEDLCDGLAYAHKRGVIHRDIKPANLMLDSEGTLKILDFGIARAAAEAGMTQAGLLLGTLNYMSPEQVAGREVDGRSDMFAVGAVLYELLTKRQAFPGSIDTGVLNRILNGEPEPLEALCPHLDPAIYAIVHRALAKTPSDRYADLQQMRVEVTRVRQALEASALGDLDATIAVLPIADSATVARPVRRGTDREELARRRSQQIEEQLAAARQALDAGAPDEAIACCERALLLDPDHAGAFDLAERARFERDQAHARNLLHEAHESLRKGELTGASSLLREVLALAPESPDAIELGRLVGEARLIQERERQRVADMQVLLTEAGRALDAGDPDAALRASDEALRLTPADEAARQMRARAEEARAGRARLAAEQRARDTVGQARSLFAAGQHADALALLEGAPAHPLVAQAWSGLSSDMARLAYQQDTLSSASPPRDAPFDATVFVPRAPESSRPSATPPAPGAEPAARRAATQDVAAAAASDDALPLPSSSPQAAAGKSDRPEPPRAAARAAAAVPARPGSAARLPLYAGAAVVLILLAVAGYVFSRDSAPPTDTLASNEASLNTPPAGGAPSLPEPESIASSDPSVAASAADEPSGDASAEPAPAPSPPPLPAPAQPASPATAAGRSGTADPVRPEAEPRPEPPRPRAAQPAPPDSSPSADPLRGDEARALPAEPPPVVIPPPPAAPAAEPAPESPRPAADPPPAAPDPPPPAAPVIPDRELIQSALMAYAAAFTAMDPAAIARLHPSIDRASLQKTFGDLRWMKMSITIDNVQVKGDTAVVGTRVSQNFQSNAGSPVRRDYNSEFRMQKRDNRWIIADRR